MRAPPGSCTHSSDSLFFFSGRRRHTRWPRDWSSYVCSSDLGTLGSYAAVELVFNLQQTSVQLLVLPLFVSDFNGLIVGVGLGNGATQGIHVAGQIVVTHHQRVLSLALIPQIPHPQRGGMGRIEAVFVIAKLLQLMLAPLHKRAVHRRRGAKQVN